MKNRGLGRGLDSLFKSSVTTGAKAGSVLPIASLISRADQPRKYFNEEALSELAESIRAQGILQPILVRQVEGSEPEQYEIIAGERRYLAAKQVGLAEVPVLIRDVKREDVLLIALIENMQRENLNAVEEARAIADIQNELGLSQDELAIKLGKSRPTVANSLRLLNLPSVMLESIVSEEISAGHARALLAVQDAQVQTVLYQAILDRSLSVRDAEAAVTHFKKHGALPEYLSGFKPTAKKHKRTKSAIIQSLQKHLRTIVHPKAILSGNEEAGRVILPYESAEQLANMLDILGINDKKSGEVDE